LNKFKGYKGLFLLVPLIVFGVLFFHTVFPNINTKTNGISTEIEKSISLVKRGDFVKFDDEWINVDEGQLMLKGSIIVINKTLDRKTIDFYMFDRITEVVRYEDERYKKIAFEFLTRRRE